MKTLNYKGQRKEMAQKILQQLKTRIWQPLYCLKIQFIFHCTVEISFVQFFIHLWRCFYLWRSKLFESVFKIDLNICLRIFHLTLLSVWKKFFLLWNLIIYQKLFESTLTKIYSIVYQVRWIFYTYLFIWCDKEILYAPATSITFSNNDIN